MSKWVTLTLDSGLEALVPVDAILWVEGYSNYNKNIARIYVKGLKLHVANKHEPGYRADEYTEEVEVLHCEYTALDTLKFLLQMSSNPSTKEA
jgi:hypothetical protein